MSSTEHDEGCPKHYDLNQDECWCSKPIESRQIQLSDPVSALALSIRAEQALLEVGADKVGHLLYLELQTVARIPGVGEVTLGEVAEARGRVRRRFI